MVVHGMNVRARMLQEVAICIFCNGVEKMVVHGMNKHVLLLHAMKT